MAKFYPELCYIEKDLMTPPTSGEHHLLNLLKNLDDDYHVYFQSHINYSHPDIVITHPNRGILIIEVKDWNLSSYEFVPGKSKKDANGKTVADKFGSLTLRNGEAKGLLSPYEQVDEYKRNLYYLLSLELRYSLIRNTKSYNLVKTAVYFSEASNSDVKTLFVTSGQLSKQGELNKYAQYIFWWSKDEDDIIVDQIEMIMNPSELFTRGIYDELEGIFSLSREWIEQGEPVILDEVQEEYAKSRPGEKMRIRGVAGSGKTLIIAQRAVNCYHEKRERVLILTFNITVCNYIQDKIARITRGMNSRKRAVCFELMHFDSFLPQLISECGLKQVDKSKYLDEYGKLKMAEYQMAQIQLLKENANRIPRYSTVIIDEAQDYKYAWFSFIEDYVARPDAEILIVADEKQNIYIRQLDENKRVRIPGFKYIPWKRLEKNYRMSEYNYALALAFQEYYFSHRYELDKKTEAKLQFSLLEDQVQGVRLLYDLTGTPGMDSVAHQLYRIIRDKCVRELGVSFNDICVMADNMYPLQKVDKYLREAGQQTMTMFETYEQYVECKQKYGVEENCDEKIKMRRKAELDNEIEQLRRIKKKGFRMNPGTVKLSSIHSFKGWEIDTVILLIDNNDDKEEKDELIYTAITRAKRNLIIINYGNTRYVPFLKAEKELVKTLSI